MKRNLPQRRRIRKPDHDYQSAGYYMVTMNVKRWVRILSRIDGNEAFLTPIGAMCDHWWRCIPKKFPGVTLHEFVFMPDHMHGLVHLDGSVSLSSVLQWYKSITTNQYRKGVASKGWPHLDGHLWHRAYWDDIIRNDAHLRNVSAYIRSNPERWKR